MKKITEQANYFILTGGPGSGKTSVLQSLAARGFLTVPEVARALIQKQQVLGGKATHHSDRCLFRDLMLEQSLRDYQRMQIEKQIVFFDRGIPELHGYSKVFCGESSLAVIQAVAEFRYNPTVFIFPPWEAIYQNDKERKQDFQEAIVTYIAIKGAYQDCAYKLVEVPKFSVEERVDFILKMLRVSF